MAFLGFKHSPESKKRMSLAKKGKYLGEENPFWKKKHSQESKLLISANHSRYWKGKKLSEHVKEKMSTSKRGNRSYLWKGGVTEKNLALRKSFEYKIWRTHVFQRDDYTCQACGERGGRLVADHELPFAYFPDLRFKILNGRTLCYHCHAKTPTFGHRCKSFALMNGWENSFTFTSVKLGASTGM